MLENMIADIIGRYKNEGGINWKRPSQDRGRYKISSRFNVECRLSSAAIRQMRISFHLLKLVPYLTLKRLSHEAVVSDQTTLRTRLSHGEVVSDQATLLALLVYWMCLRLSSKISAHTRPTFKFAESRAQLLSKSPSGKSSVMQGMFVSL